MRSIYTHTGWTFNAIWVQSRPSLVTWGVKGRTFCKESIRHTWHFVLTSAECVSWKPWWEGEGSRWCSTSKGATNENAHQHEQRSTRTHFHLTSLTASHPTLTFKSIFYVRQWLWACEWGRSLRLVHCCANSHVPNDRSGLNKWSHTSDDITV